MTTREQLPAAPGSRRAGPAADVGRWFSTATSPVATDAARALPRAPAWGPVDGAEYGRTSSAAELEAALDLLACGPVAVLTGAGMSTASGLPDYRGRHAVPRSPMTYQ